MKRYLTRVLCMVLMVQLLVTTTVNMELHAATLTDISNHWAKEYIQTLVDAKAVNGYPDGTFKPNGTITRAAFLTVLVKAMGLELGDNVYFDDMRNHWSNPYVAASVEAGLIVVTDYPGDVSNGFLIGYNFDPDVNITREEMAQIITRALGLEYQAFDISATDFVDSASIDREIIGSVAIASESGIITGYPGGDFGPKKSATRAEACVMINRLLDYNAIQGTDALNSEEIYDLYKDSVVKVRGKYEGVWDDYGSGFVIDQAGRVVTNFHVVEGTTELEVVFTDGTTKKVVDISNYNRALDVAVLNLEAGEYTPVNIGSSRNVKIGSTVYSIGYPLVNNLTIGDGLVSSKLNLEGNNYIQVSAPISPGSSGGVLVNKAGQVIGITSATFLQGQNMNLVIPISDVTRVLGEQTHLNITAACKSSLNFTDNEIGGFAAYTTVFFTNNSDGSSPEYEEIVGVNDYRYLGFDVSLYHNIDIKDNLLYLVGILYDGYGEMLSYEYFQTYLFDNGWTSDAFVFSSFDVQDMEEGDFYVEVYGMDDFLDSDKACVRSDKSYDDYEPKSLTMKIFDYQQFEETDNLVYKTSWEESDFTGIGLEIDGVYGHVNDTEYVQYMLFDVVIEKDGERLIEDTTSGMFEPGGSSFGYYYTRALDSLEAGNYRISLLYNGEYVVTKDFVITAPAKMDLPDQTLEIIGSYNDDYPYFGNETMDFDERLSYLDTSDKTYSTDYYMKVLATNINFGYISHDRRVHVAYRLRSEDEDPSILTDDLITINSDDYNLTPAHSYQDINIDLFLVLDQEMRKAAINGKKILIDVYVDGVLIDTIENLEVIVEDFDYDYVGMKMTYIDDSADETLDDLFEVVLDGGTFYREDIKSLSCSVDVSRSSEAESHIFLPYLKYELVNLTTGVTMKEEEFFYGAFIGDDDYTTFVIYSEWEIIGELTAGEYQLNVYLSEDQVEPYIGGFSVVE